MLRDDINRWLDCAESRGMLTYGVSLEDTKDGRDWREEMISELIDALYYAAKELRELREKARTPFDGDFSD